MWDMWREPGNSVIKFFMNGIMPVDIFAGWFFYID